MGKTIFCFLAWLAYTLFRRIGKTKYWNFFVCIAVYVFLKSAAFLKNAQKQQAQRVNKAKACVKKKKNTKQTNKENQHQPDKSHSNKISSLKFEQTFMKNFYISIQLAIFSGFRKPDLAL